MCEIILWEFYIYMHKYKYIYGYICINLYNFNLHVYFYRWARGVLGFFFFLHKYRTRQKLAIQFSIFDGSQSLQAIFYSNFLRWIAFGLEFSKINF